MWLGLFEPSDEELAQVRDTFGLHELAGRGCPVARHISSHTAFILYGLGGLVVPLALLFLWLRLRTLRPNTAPVRDN